MTAAKAKRRGPKTKRKEKQKAEAFIEQAKTKVTRNRKRSEPWVELGLTEEQIVQARDKQGLSWRDVATTLGLANPGQARKAYEALTGRPHNSSVMTGPKAKRGTGGSKVVLKPEWNNESDPQEIADAIDGRLLIVESPSGAEFEPEELHVYRILGFGEYSNNGDPADLYVSFIEGIRRIDEKTGEPYIDSHSTGHTRHIRVSRIMDVR